jgi:hypothetical protein
MVLEMRNAFDSTQVHANGVRVGSVDATEPGLQSINVRYAASGEEELVVQAVGYQNGRPFYSPKATITAVPRPPRVGEYINEFDSFADRADFLGEGFTISRVDHWLTASPYPANSNLTYTLTVPVQVSDVNSMMTWSDIALVQPGLPNFDYTQIAFRDYVIVEATANGTTWVPLVDGYDATFDGTWQSAYPSGQAPTRDMLRDHTVDLRNFFDVGQIIFIRFRLYSDASNQGAGWFIDRLEVQQGAPVANEAAADLPTEFALHANYPNPFNPSTSISFSLPKRTEVRLRIFDTNGRAVETIASGDFAAGHHTVSWDAIDLASGMYFYQLEAGSFVQTRKMLLVK